MNSCLTAALLLVFLAVLQAQQPNVATFLGSDNKTLCKWCVLDCMDPNSKLQNIFKKCAKREYLYGCDIHDYCVSLTAPQPDELSTAVAFCVMYNGCEFADDVFNYQSYVDKSPSLEDFIAKGLDFNKYFYNINSQESVDSSNDKLFAYAVEPVFLKRMAIFTFHLPPAFFYYFKVIQDLKDALIRSSLHQIPFDVTSFVNGVNAEVNRLPQWFRSEFLLNPISNYMVNVYKSRIETNQEISINSIYDLILKFMKVTEEYNQKMDACYQTSTNKDSCLDVAHQRKDALSSVETEYRNLYNRLLSYDHIVAQMEASKKQVDQRVSEKRELQRFALAATGKSLAPAYQPPFRCYYFQRALKFTLQAPPPRIPPCSPLRRYYNPYNGDHFYTANADEIGVYQVGQMAKGYKYEGVVGYCQMMKEINNVPLYRYYNPSSGDHFYTTNAAEIGTTVAGRWGKSGYVSEGIACYILPGFGSWRYPLYRYWNGRDHFYTNSGTEIRGGPYKYEGLAGYIFSRPNCKIY